MKIRRSRARWTALVAVQCLIAAAFALVLRHEHQRIGAREGDRLQGQAKVINDNLVRQLDGANHALSGVRDEVESLGITEASLLTSRLQLLASAMPGVRTMSILDARGRIVASSRAELLGTDSTGRDFFEKPRQQPQREMLYISTPFRSPLGPFVVNVSRTLSDAQGRFAGLVVATLDPAYFEVVLGSVIYAPDMRVALVHGDGHVFVNMPMNQPALGMNLDQPGSLFSRHRQSGKAATLASGRSLATGLDRMVAMQDIGRPAILTDMPMVTAVSRELPAVYATWREQALQLGLLLAVIVLGSDLGLYLHQKRRQALDRLTAASAAERQQSAERLELALRGADLGLWDVQLPEQRLILNARERTLLGYTADEALSKATWTELIHPDDRPLIDAAMQPHLRGEIAAFECEHRIRHRDGHWLWVFSRGMVVERDAVGAPLRVVGTHLDITERKRTDAELARTLDMLQLNEEQLRELTDNLPALVSRIDRDQRFRFANRAFRDWLDIDPASLLGRSLWEVYREPTYGSFRHHVETALGGTRVVYERTMNTPRGPRHVEITLIPHRAADGSVRGLYSLVNDLTDRHEAELQRARSEERLSLALEGSGLALFDWDIANDRLYHSAKASAMLNEPAIETVTSAAEMRAFLHPDDLNAMFARMREAVTGATPTYQAEFRIRQRGGSWLWLRAIGRVVQRNAAGKALRLAGTYADINERKLSEQRLRHLAEFDTLTDLPNRAQFHDRLQQAMGRATREQAMALLFLDIDHFKSINDTLGHEAGDQLLKAFAGRMRETVRLADTVARLGGDEFTIILEGLRDLGDARSLANKLVNTFQQPIVLAGQPLRITISIGVAMCRTCETADALLGRADAALYEAKRLGRNRSFCDETTQKLDGVDAAAG